MYRDIKIKFKVILKAIFDTFIKYQRYSRLRKVTSRYNIKYKISSSEEYYLNTGKIKLSNTNLLTKNDVLYVLTPEEVWENKNILENLSPSEAKEIVSLYFKSILDEMVNLKIKKRYFDIIKNTIIFDVENNNTGQVKSITIEELISNPNLIKRLDGKDAAAAGFESGYLHAEKIDKIIK